MASYMLTAALDNDVAIHPFGTLAVLPALQTGGLEEISRSSDDHVIKLDNGHYYFVTHRIARHLVEMTQEAKYMHGDATAKDIINKGTAMVWSKGSNTPHAYITLSYNGRQIERRVLAAELSLYPEQ